MATIITTTDIMMSVTIRRSNTTLGSGVMRAITIPRTAKGTPIINFLQLAGGEKITSTLPLDKLAKSKYLFFATEKGLVKKVEISAFANVRRSGLIAIKIKDDDKLIWTKPTNGDDLIQLITAMGQAIVRLLADRALRERMGQAGLARVKALFTVERMVEATAAIYARVITTKRSDPEPGT